MISLTFIRNSDGSHGTVGRITGFWSGRYGFETQTLPTFYNLINTMENRDTPSPQPLIHKRFRYGKFSKHSTEGFLHEIFRYCETKKYSTEKKSSYPPPPPPLSIKLFDPGNFLKHRRVPLRCFSVLWDKQFSTENRDTPCLPSPSPSPSYPYNFSITEIFWTTEAFPYEVFRYYETTNFRRKILILPPSPSYP